MPKSDGQKLKLLHLLRLLEEESGKEHPVSTERMIEYLAKHGIRSERKTIYDDMTCLKEFGYDIHKESTRRGGGYYLGKREFELAELKLLVDAVQSSRFITTSKSRELIGKLEAKAGRFDAGQLQRDVYVIDRVKSENESIYSSVDLIHRAIQENKQISFLYLDWNLKKEMAPRNDILRVVSPWALIWNNENYYLVAYDRASESIKHYRVDKIGKAKLLEQSREGNTAFDQENPASYSNQTFGMFGGKTETVTLEFPDHLIGVVIDRFGKDVSIREMSDEKFQVRIKVAVSGQFFGWLAGIGKAAKICRPEHVKEAYHAYLSEILKDQQ